MNHTLRDYKQWKNHKVTTVWKRPSYRAPQYSRNSESDVDWDTWNVTNSPNDIYLHGLPAENPEATSEAAHRWTLSVVHWRTVRVVAGFFLRIMFIWWSFAFLRLAGDRRRSGWRRAGFWARKLRTRLQRWTFTRRRRGRSIGRGDAFLLDAQILGAAYSRHFGTDVVEALVELDDAPAQLAQHAILLRDLLRQLAYLPVTSRDAPTHLGASPTQLFAYQFQLMSLNSISRHCECHCTGSAWNHHKPRSTSNFSALSYHTYGTADFYWAVPVVIIDI